VSIVTPGELGKFSTVSKTGWGNALAATETLCTNTIRQSRETNGFLARMLPHDSNLHFWCAHIQYFNRTAYRLALDALEYIKCVLASTHVEDAEEEPSYLTMWRSVRRLLNPYYPAADYYSLPDDAEASILLVECDVANDKHYTAAERYHRGINLDPGTQVQARRDNSAKFRPGKVGINKD
jgi:hypothetical protein